MEKKVAIITGGGQGIGRGIALAMAKRGNDVVVCDIDKSLADEVAKEAQQLGVESIAIDVDLANPSQIDSMIARVLSHFGHVDILVNNAGITVYMPALEMTSELWDKVMSVNLRSQFLCGIAAGREMAKQRSGKIINIASAAAHGAVPSMMAYCVSKTAVLALTRCLATELAEYNINVNSVSPGMTMTTMAQKHKKTDPEGFAARVNRVPMGRAAEVEDIANAVVFLASDEAAYISGRDIAVDGGMFAIHPGFVKS